MSKTTYYTFRITGDGSVGLFNHQVNDIYHSSYGAKNEAKEKFITPLNFENNFFNKKELRILDICYGIGYNTKSILEKIILSGYKGKVQIDILEYDKSLVCLSPIINDGFWENTPEVSYILFNSLLETIIENKSLITSVLSDEKNKQYLTPFYRELIKKYHNWGYKYNPTRSNNSFLHNIYYHCVSSRSKTHPKHPKINNFSIKPYFNDARTTIKSLDNAYDIVFLDAFTPAKLPTLWSYDFFNELYRLTNENSLLVTYSNSAAVRHAMCDIGFSVGKIFDKKGRASGTIASHNPDLILNKLDEYDLGLMNTGAGVYYRDPSLSSTGDEILLEHSIRKKDLNLESSSSYIKHFKNKGITNDK